MSNISTTITEQIISLPEDITFGYGQLIIPAEQYQSAAKVLERLQKKGLIRKLSKGVFYKPKNTVFGEKRPGEDQLLKPYLYRDGQRVAYITGTYLYNQMGLTTQIPAVIQIANRDRRIFVNRGSIRATPVKSYVDVTDDNYQLLGLLDALKDLKDIPDLDLKAAIGILTGQIQQLSKIRLKELTAYAFKYPPRVRALLGAILASTSKSVEETKLRASLNPLTTFKMGIDDQLLPSAPEWNIR